MHVAFSDVCKPSRSESASKLSCIVRNVSEKEGVMVANEQGFTLPILSLPKMSLNYSKEPALLPDVVVNT